MPRQFRVPFATQGDRDDIPVDTQGDGSLSYTQGYGFDYEREYSDPNSKDISREGLNGLLHDITEAVGLIQTAGVAEWSQDGTPYAAETVLNHNGDVWISRVNNNNSEPQNGSNWETISQRVMRLLGGRRVNAGRGLTGGGDLTRDRDIGLSDSTITSLERADSAIQSEDLAPVASGGRYNQLTGLPPLGSAASRNVQNNVNDTDLSKLMLVGAFGLGSGNVQTISDWDAIRVTGFYSNTSGETIGVPASYSQMTMIHVANGSFHTQLAFRSNASNQQFWRRTYNNGWSIWVELYHSGNQLALGTTGEGARDALGLGTAATRTAGINADNLMPVGAFGLGSEAILVNDFNSITRGGLYVGESSSALNGPPGHDARGCHVYHNERNSNNAAQFCVISYGDSAAYFRHKSSGSWQAWKLIFDKSNQLALGTSASSARSALNLGSAALAAAESFLQRSSNLNDLPSKSSARSNLGLGSAAQRNVGQSVGDLIEVNAFGIGPRGLGLNSVNLNETIDNGLYYVNDASSNKPTNNGGSLIVFGDNNLKAQIFITRTGVGNFWYRSLNQGAWAPWEQSYNTSNFKPGQNKRSFATVGSYTFTVPEELKSGRVHARVAVRGAGGGGAKDNGGAGGGGAQGGFAFRTVNLSGVDTVTVTVGRGGIGGSLNNGEDGTPGTTSSFGNYHSATGGQGGNRASGSTGGRGFSGDYNEQGAPGGIGLIRENITYSGNGGNGAPAKRAAIGDNSEGVAGVMGGSGASGGNGTGTGGRGSDGYVSIEW